MLTLASKSDSHELFHGDGQELYDKYCGEPAHTLIFDPPWDSMSGFDMRRSDNILAFCDGFRAADVIRLFGAPAWVFVWDCVSCWYTPNRPLRRMKMCFWYGDLRRYSQKGSLVGHQSTRPRLVSNSRGEYLFRPDSGKMLADVFSSPITSLHSRSGHEHSKPQEWIAALIANTSPARGVVIDPFAGSGVTLSAARSIGMRWIGCDIDAARVTDIARMAESSSPPLAPRQLGIFDDSNEPSTQSADAAA